MPSDKRAPAAIKPPRPAPEISRRLPMTAAQVDAIVPAAKAAGAGAHVVRDPAGRFDEVAIWHAGESVGSAFRPADGGLAVWISNSRQHHAASAADAVRKVLTGYGAKPPAAATGSCGVQSSNTALGGVSARAGRVVAGSSKKPPAGFQIGFSSASASRRFQTVTQGKRPRRTTAAFIATSQMAASLPRASALSACWRRSS